MAKEELVDFIKSLERRLNRDIKRVYDYYETLKEETVRVIEKKRAIMEDSGLDFQICVEDRGRACFRRKIRNGINCFLD